VAQDRVEPGDNAFIFLELRPFLNHFEIAGLQNVFSSSGPCLCREKPHKRRTLSEQLLDEYSRSFGRE
jgi:hypothetical protein